MKIEKIIIHQVFETIVGGKNIQPRISSQFSPINQEMLSTLQQRITNVIGEESNSVEMIIHDDSQGSVFSCCRDIMFANDQEIIKSSGYFATKLAHAQLGKHTPGGVVVVIIGTIGNSNNKFVGIVKAEMHDGFTINEENSSLFMQFLNNLFLTPQQKLYKIGLFINQSPQKPKIQIKKEDFCVFVYDHLMSRNETNPLAIYFYDDFLGCQYSQNDRILTMDFYSLTKKFINNLNLDDDQKIELRSQFFSFLRNKNFKTIQISDFAENILPEEERESYLTFMKMNGVFSHAFLKDTCYIENQLKKRQFTFSSEVKIVAPSSIFDDAVKIIDFQENETIVRISGKLASDE